MILRLILRFRVFPCRLPLVFIALLSLPAYSQERLAMRIGVTTPAGEVQGVSNTSVRDRLVKAINQHKTDKKLKISVEAVALDAAPGAEALAEAAKKNCGFVLYNRLRPLQNSYHFERTPDGSVTHTPVTVAIVEYLLRGVENGASYASGSVTSDESVSNRDAILEAFDKAGKSVVVELAKGRGAQSASEASGFLNEISPSPVASAGANKNLCDWLPDDLPHAGALRGVCEYAMTLRQRMPNFICQEETARYAGHSRVPSDLITATVRSQDGEESYGDVRRNGKPAPDAVGQAGLWSSGQFEGNLRDVFHVANHPVFKFLKEDYQDGRPAWVFTYQIARQNEPLWQLRAENEVIAPPYEGQLWVDQETGALLRFRSAAKDLPIHFPLQSAEVVIDYGNVEFGDGTAFVLPVESSVATQYENAEPTRNVMRFRGCHKFRAKARIVVNLADNTVGGSDAASLEDLKAELEQNNTIYDILRQEAIQQDDAQRQAEQNHDLDIATVAAFHKLALLRQEHDDNSELQATTAQSNSPLQGTASATVPVFRISVKLVPVSVVPRNAKGHAVGNLNKENFQLFDERKPQLITRFTVEKGDAEAPGGFASAPAAEQASAAVRAITPARSVAFVFDDLHLDSDDLRSAADVAMRYLTEMTDHASVALFSTSGEVLVNFTSDREVLASALKKLRAHPMPGWNCPPMSYYEADLIVNHADATASALAVGEALECAHGYTAGPARRLAEARALEVLNTGRVNSRQSLEILQEVVTKTAGLSGRRTIVLVSPGFVTPDPGAEDRLMELIDRAVDAGIVVNTLDAVGVGDTPESNPGGDLTRNQIDRQEETDRAETMADLAYGTGGTFFHRSNDLKEGFRRTGDAPEYLYVLGFAPQKLDGKFHKLKVTLNSPEKLTVQARPGYYAAKSDANR